MSDFSSIVWGVCVLSIKCAWNYFVESPRQSNPKFHRPATFDINDLENADIFLKKNGYVVIRKAISANEISTALDLLWKFLENLGTGIVREDPTTYDSEKWPPRHKSGNIGWFGAGQSEFMWYLRTRSNVKKIFAHIWKTEELNVSFDGFGALRPWKFNPDWKTYPIGSFLWHHTDQDIEKRGYKLWCYQGLLNLLPADENTGGFFCIPGTHDEVFKQIKIE